MVARSDTKNNHKYTSPTDSSRNKVDELFSVRLSIFGCKKSLLNIHQLVGKMIWAIWAKNVFNIAQKSTICAKQIVASCFKKSPKWR